MKNTWRNISISLAGICQATSLVEQLAKTGYLQSEPFETAVKSLFEQNPDSTESIFGDITRLEHGYEVLLDLLNNHRAPKNADVLRYVLGVMHIQKRINRRSDMLHVIGTRLDTANRQADHFGVNHDNTIANIAEIYTDTISKLPYRIQVTGEYGYLQQQRVANQVRVLLLAAVRASTVWRQNGGSRWHMLFHRSKIVDATQELLKECKERTLH